MKKQLVIATTIAALLAGTSLVSAQRSPDGTSGAPSTSPAQSAPSQQNRTMQSQGGSPMQSQSPSQAQSPSQSPSPSQAQSPSTPGGRDASGTSQTNVNVNLSADQRTRIRETVVKQSNVPRIRRSEVNFNLSIGTVMPRTVRVATLPAAIIEIHPAWRGYSYFLVGDEIVIVEPGTLRIVAIIPAYWKEKRGRGSGAAPVSFFGLLQSLADSLRKYIEKRTREKSLAGSLAVVRVETLDHCAHRRGA